MDGTPVSSRDHQYDSNEEQTSNQMYSLNAAVIKSEVDEAVIKEEYVDFFSSSVGESNVKTSIKIEKSEIEDNSGWTISIPEHLSTGQFNSVPVIKLEVEQVEENYHFKSEIKHEVNEDFGVIKGKDVGLFSADYVESNSDNMCIKIEEMDIEKICDVTFSISEPLSSSVGKSNVETKSNKTKEAEIEKPTSHKIMHKGEKNFKCDLCQKTFSQSGHLNSHKRTHTGERPFKCEMCSKTFTRAGYLKTHIMTHTGERPFQCETCLKTFTKKGILKEHKMTHTGEKPFQCEMCLKTFSQSGHLITHKKTHTDERPFQCDVCLKTFRLSGYIKTHKRTHTGERPFQCEVCLKTFLESGTLKRHKWTHTNERPYKCEVCLKTFSLTGTLKRHKLTHHMDDRPTR